MKSNLSAKPAGLSFLSTLALSIVLGLASVAHSATNVVTSLADSGSGSLRQAIADAATGDTIMFNITGTISLWSMLSLAKDISILGPGASLLTISGNRSTRLLGVSAGVNARVSCMTLRDGKAPDGANATGSSMAGPGEPGGAITNAGFLMLWDCVLTNNIAGSGGGGYLAIGYSSGGAGGAGGAIYNLGTLAVSNCVFTRNVSGGGGFPAGDRISNIGGNGGNGGHGGAICGLGPVSLINCSVNSNSCAGGTNGFIAGAGGWGGCGGGIYALSQLTVVGCTLSGNRTGSGGRGGNTYYGFRGGDGGAGGSGGGIYAGGLLWMTNCTTSGNYCGVGGDPGWPLPPGPAGNAGNGGSGGGLFCATGATSLAVVSCTTVSNSCGVAGLASSSQNPPPANGSGAGICLSSAAVSGGVLNNIVALGVWRTQDVSGVFNSLGHNLIGATNGSSGFTGSGDLVGSAAAPLDPLLGPLADNGGPTLTMALLPGSPAIGAGSPVGAPPTDQRGVARPRQGAVDIGAFQYSFDIPELYVYQIAPTGIQLSGAGKPTQSCRLLASYDLAIWSPISTNQFGADGTILFQDTWSSSSRSRFYRLVTP